MKAGCGREIKRSPRRYEHNGEKACMLPGRGKQKGETHPVLELRKEETRVQSLGWEDPLEKGMATHSNILAWRIPWAEELGRL